ncbi:hypothetical protein [Paeniglutamicibacter terrestris]|uniref:Uncharacterized protein n=1 Tax=Paeniglutamicibacter terrestris TaxID=2723403 RepID=A0ABX1G8N5_9MICC|nr:hypothetical protein [Paeniglutamicibacter terrestris]NKG22005.1 hypothetical protein [Paeniglutamicibacter terrestris]
MAKEHHPAGPFDGSDVLVITAHAIASKAITAFYEANQRDRATKAATAHAAIGQAREALLSVGGAPAEIKRDIIAWVGLQGSQTFIISDISTPEKTVVGQQNRIKAEASDSRKSAQNQPSRHAKEQRKGLAQGQIAIGKANPKVKARQTGETISKVQIKGRGTTRTVSTPVVEPLKSTGNNPFMPVTRRRPARVTNAGSSTPNAQAVGDFENVKRKLMDLRAQLKHTASEYHARQILKERAQLLKNDIARFRAKHVANSGSPENRKNYMELERLFGQCRWRPPRKGNSGSVLSGGLPSHGTRY